MARIRVKESEMLRTYIGINEDEFAQAGRLIT